MAYFRCTGNSGGSLKLRTAQGEIASFETNLPEPLQSVTVNVVATGGYDADTQTAHPINGYTEATITRCGVNLWDEEWEVGYISVLDGTNSNSQINIRSKNYIPIKPNVSLYLKANIATVYCPIIFYDKDKNFLSSIAQTIWNRTITTPENAYYMRFYMHDSYGTTYNNDISINYPSTDTTYHAYNGQTYTIAFGQTVYGGVLDVTRGKLTVNTWFLQKTWGDFYKTTIGSYVRGSAGLGLDNVYPPTAEIPQLCNIAPCVVSYAEDSLHFYCNDTTAFVFLPVGTSDDTVIQLRGELATPFDIDLTPVQIRALVGENNVFADCGETEVEYLYLE